MPKDIKVKQRHMQISGSKQINIQIEIKTNTNKHDISVFLCNGFQFGQEADCNMAYPHQAAFLAYIIQELRAEFVNIKAKLNKNTAIQLEYGVLDGILIISLNFGADNSVLRAMCKSVANTVFSGRTELAYKQLNQNCKEFCKTHGKETIQSSMISLLSDISISILSKHESIKQFMDMLTKEISKKKQQQINDPLSSLQQQSISEEYVLLDVSRKNMGDLLFNFLISSMNMQNIDFIVQKDKIHIKKGHIKVKTRDRCKKFIKERLLFLDPKKVKSYKDQTDDYKKRYTEKQHNEKMQQQRKNKIQSVLFVLYSSGSVLFDDFSILENDLNKLNYNQFNTKKEQLEFALTEIIKKR